MKAAWAAHLGVVERGGLPSPLCFRGRCNGRKQDPVSSTQCESPARLLLPRPAGCLPSSLWSDYLSSHRDTPNPSSLTPFPMAQGSIKHKTPAKCLRPPTVRKKNQMKMKKLASLIYCKFFQCWDRTFWFSYARQSICSPPTALKNLLFLCFSDQVSPCRLG